MVPDLVLGGPLHRLVFVVPLVPHIECAIKSSLLVGGLLKLPQGGYAGERLRFLRGNHLKVFFIVSRGTTPIAVHLFVLLAEKGSRDTHVTSTHA